VLNLFTFFILAIVLPVLRFTSSDCPFDILKLFLLLLQFKTIQKKIVEHC